MNTYTNTVMRFAQRVVSLVAVGLADGHEKQSDANDMQILGERCAEQMLRVQRQWAGNAEKLFGFTAAGS